MTHDEAVAVARGMIRQILDAIEAGEAQCVDLRREQNGALQTIDVRTKSGVKIATNIYGLDVASMRSVNEEARKTQPPIHLVVPSPKKKSSRRA